MYCSHIKILIAGIVISFHFITGISAQQKMHLSHPLKRAHQDKSVPHYSSPILTAYPFQLYTNGAIALQKNSKNRFAGTVKHHRLHGAWQSWHLNGQLLDEGKLVKGIADGVWKVWDAQGNLLAVRTYHAELFHKIKDEIGLNHPKRYFYALTSMYKKEGWAIANYFKSAYSFFSNQPGHSLNLEELVERNTADIKQYHPAFNQCLHHGLYVNYYSNGHVKDSGYYKEGLRHGVWLHHTETGTWKGAYKNGAPEYQWKFYNALGQLSTIVFYNRSGKEEWRKKM